MTDANASGSSLASGAAQARTVEEIDRLLAAAESVKELDEAGVKRLALALEKRITKNQELRIKFADDPSRFLESEELLHVAIRDVQQVAAFPSLMSVLLSVGTVRSLLGLMVHENSDIAAAAIGALQDFTDAETLADEAAAENVAAEISRDQGLGMLVEVLKRLSDRDDHEAQAFFNVLGIVENLADARPESIEDIVEQSSILTVLFNRLKMRDFSSNKQYSSEVLSILLQSSAKNRKALQRDNGIDQLLQCVAQYKKKEVDDPDERETLENIFNALCVSLLDMTNRTMFLRCEGIELMLIFVRNRVFASHLAVKVLDFALLDSRQACERFVDVLGLKTLFRVFVRGDKHVRKHDDVQTFEDHLLGCILSLFMQLSDVRLARVAAKFSENDYEKVDRLIEIYARYAGAVASVDSDKLRADGADDDTVAEARLQAGLSQLQRTCLLLAYAALTCGDAGFRHIVKQFGTRSLSISFVHEILQEYAAEADEDDTAKSLAAKVRILARPFAMQKE